MDRLLRFDYVTQTSVQSLLGKIDAYNKDWKRREMLDVDQLRTLRQIASVYSTGSSTRIEGSAMTDEQVATLIENLDITKLRSRDEQEVAGYYSVLEIIQEQYEDMKLSVSIIKGLHNELMRYSIKDAYHKGDFKQHSNRVVARDADGNERTVFNTTDVFQTAEAMEDAVNWYNAKVAEGKHHSLVLIAAFIYEFLSIHPFQDGNGRLSRLLTNMLLLRAGYDFVLYTSLDQKIEDNKKSYCKALMVAQRYRGQEQEEIGRFTYFLLKCIYTLTDNIDDQTETILKEPEALYLTRRLRDALSFVRQEGELSVREIDELLPTISRSTVKNDVAKLATSGYLTRHGKGRGTVYTAN